MRVDGLFEDWWRADPTNALESEPLRALLALWESRKTVRGLPSRTDFSSEELMAYGGRIALVEVERNPIRYRYRLIGSLITGALGRDSTGRYFDELYTDNYLHRMEAHFGTVVRDRVALRSFGTMAHSYKPHVAVEGIDMPLAADGQTVDMIVRALDFE